MPSTIKLDESTSFFACSFHKTNSHTNAECKKRTKKNNNSKKQFSTTPKTENTSFLSVEDPNIQSSTWYIDSGASFHMTSDRSIFDDIKSTTDQITISNGQKMIVTGIGNIKLPVLINGETKLITLTQVRLVPDLKFNLFSEICALHKGYNIHKVGNRMLIQKQNVTTLQGHQLQGSKSIFVISTPTTPPDSSTQAMALVTITPMEAHKRLGHAHYNVIQGIRSGKTPSDIIISAGSIPDACRECILSKHRRTAKYFH